MLALKYLLSISVKKLQEKWLFKKKKKKSDEKVQFLRWVRTIKENKKF